MVASSQGQSRVDTVVAVLRSVLGHDRVFHLANEQRQRSGINIADLEQAYTLLEQSRKPLIWDRQRRCGCAAQDAVDDYLHSLQCDEDGYMLAVGLSNVSEDRPGLNDANSMTSYSGLLFSVESRDNGKDALQSTASRLQEFALLAADAHEHDRHERFRQRDEEAQAFFIRLCRLAQGESSSDMSAAGQSSSDTDVRIAGIFKEAAEFLCDWFGDTAEGCVIVDASDVRFVNATTAERQEREEKIENPSGGEFVPRSTFISGADACGMGGATLDPAVGEPTTNSELQNTVQHSSEDTLKALKDTKSSGTDSSKSTRISTAESYIPVSSQGSVCSFLNTSEAVSILGSANVAEATLQRLPGDAVRRVTARYFATARQSGHNTRCFIDDGIATTSSDALHMRHLLQQAGTGSILCVASTDAFSQPAFLVFLSLKDRLTLRSNESIMIEAINTALTYALLRSHADALDQTQLHFIGKVQHELRTPLHAIIGLNEAFRYTLSTYANDNSLSQSSVGTSLPISTKQETQKAESRGGEPNAKKKITNEAGMKTKPFTDDDTAKIFIDLVGMSESIASSADLLSSLVDDLVDFRILKQRKVANGESSAQPAQLVSVNVGKNSQADASPNAVEGAADLNTNAEDCQSEKEESLGNPIGSSMPLVLLETVFSVISSTAEQAWALYRPTSSQSDGLPQLPPPPELAFIVDPAYLMSVGEKMMLALNLEAIRRVTWKLVMNAMQATPDGIVWVKVRHRVMQVDSPQIPPAANARNVCESVHTLEIEVKDTGKGMSPVFRKGRLFQAYQKEDPQSEGVGLSLALCRAMVEQMDGRIHARSKPGAGTSMTVSIPLQSSDPALDLGWNSTIEMLNKIHVEPCSLYFFGFEGESLHMLKEAIVKQVEGSERSTGKGAHLHGLDAVLFTTDAGDIDTLFQLAESHVNNGGTLPVFVQIPPRHDMESESSRQLPRLQHLCRTHGSRLHTVPRPFTFSRLITLNKIIRRARQPGSPLSTASDSSSSSVLKAGGKSPAMSTHSHVNSEVHLSSPLAQVTTRHPPSDIVMKGEEHELPHEFKVLVVEDNPLNARIILTLLKRSQLTCLEAKDGKEGVDIFRRELPAVVLLDINMPVMNGFDAAREIRATPSPYQHYIAAVTALSNETDKVRGFQAGMDEWFTKPLRMGPLVEDIKRRKKDYEELLGEGME